MSNTRCNFSKSLCISRKISSHYQIWRKGILSSNNWHKLHDFWESYILNHVYVIFYANCPIDYCTNKIAGNEKEAPYSLPNIQLVSSKNNKNDSRSLGNQIHISIKNHTHVKVWHTSEFLFGIYWWNWKTNNY